MNCKHPRMGVVRASNKTPACVVSCYFESLCCCMLFCDDVVVAVAVVAVVAVVVVVVDGDA